MSVIGLMYHVHPTHTQTDGQTDTQTDRQTARAAAAAGGGPWR